MIPVDVVGVRLQVPSNQPVLLLRETDGSRFLPIWIGAAEATSIAMAESDVVPPRPMTHDAVVLIMKAAGIVLTRVDITDLNDGVFYAELVLSNGAVVSVRPSDAVAIAIRVGAPITVAPSVLDEAGVAAPIEEDRQVEAFREFLDQVSPEDFSGPGSQ